MRGPIPPSTDIINRLKYKYPQTWWREVLYLYEKLSKLHPLSDDTVALAQCIQDGLKLLAEQTNIPS